MKITWPHAPLHYHDAKGAYIVTAGTYLKAHLFRTEARLNLLQNLLFEVAEKHHWLLQAWAVFSNHYHFVGVSSEASGSLKDFVRELHSRSAIEINGLDGVADRQVWFQFWDTHLSYEKSYLARLNYVVQNPVRHGLVTNAAQYPWCSANWFQQSANLSFYRTVTSFKIDRVNVRDDFEVEWERPRAAESQ